MRYTISKHIQYPNSCCCCSSCRCVRVLLLILLILLLRFRFNTVSVSFVHSISCNLFLIRTVQAVRPDEQLAMSVSSKAMKPFLFTVGPMKTCLHGSRSAAGNVHVCTRGARRVHMVSALLTRSRCCGTTDCSTIASEQKKHISSNGQLLQLLCVQ